MPAMAGVLHEPDGSVRIDCPRSPQFYGAIQKVKGILRKTPIPRRKHYLKRSPVKSYRKPIRKVSSKKRIRNTVVARLRRDKVEANGPWCQLKIVDVCTHREEGIAHLKKKSQGGKDTHENTRLSCNACNGWCEDNPIKARELGLVILRDETS